LLIQSPTLALGGLIWRRGEEEEEAYKEEEEEDRKENNDDDEDNSSFREGEAILWAGSSNSRRALMATWEGSVMTKYAV